MGLGGKICLAPNSEWTLAPRIVWSKSLEARCLDLEENQKEAQILNFTLKPSASSLPCHLFLNPKKRLKFGERLSGLGVLGSPTWPSAIFLCQQRCWTEITLEDICLVGHLFGQTSQIKMPAQPGKLIPSLHQLSNNLCWAMQEPTT